MAGATLPSPAITRSRKMPPQKIGYLHPANTNPGQLNLGGYKGLGEMYTQLERAEHNSLGAFNI